jgi:hypothetical protein
MGPFHHSRPFMVEVCFNALDYYHHEFMLKPDALVIKKHIFIHRIKKGLSWNLQCFSFYMGMARCLCDHKADESDHAKWNCKKTRRLTDASSFN